MTDKKMINNLLIFSESVMIPLKVLPKECPQCERPYIPTPKSKNLCIPCKFKRK